MTQKIGVVELVTRIGDDQLFFQNLDTVAIGYQSRKNNMTEIKFLTDAITPTEVMNGPTKMLGLVVWLPRERVAEILKSARPSGPERGEKP